MKIILYESFSSHIRKFRYLCSVNAKPFFQRCGRRTAHFLAARFFFSSHLAAQIQRFARLFYAPQKIFQKKYGKYFEGKNIYTNFASSKQTNNSNNNLSPTQHG